MEGRKRWKKQKCLNRDMLEFCLCGAGLNRRRGILSLRRIDFCLRRVILWLHRIDFCLRRSIYWHLRGKAPCAADIFEKAAFKTVKALEINWLSRKLSSSLLRFLSS
jgi:hypothetical protein